MATSGADSGSMATSNHSFDTNAALHSEPDNTQSAAHRDCAADAVPPAPPQLHLFHRHDLYCNHTNVARALQPCHYRMCSAITWVPHLRRYDTRT